MSCYTRDDILKIVKEQDVKFIRLQFTDILGTLKNVAITAERLEQALDGRYMFDGSSIEGFVRIEESDMYLKPDPNTFVIFPWRPQTGKVARLICDVYNPDGTPFGGDPRYVLKHIMQKASSMGYDTFNVGPECEFFLFFTDSEGKPTLKTHDNAGYFDLGPIDLGEDARRDMCLALEEMGFEIEASHHEVAPGQHEIDFKYNDALSAADAIMTFKLIVRTIAQRHGLHATFMPKPIKGMSGSGMHTNISLMKAGRNAFFDESAPMKLSNDALCFIGGLIRHIKSITAITNPTVNSYKRLVPDYEAPVYIAWSEKNRSPLIRIPSSRGDSTRLEIRNPDPSCNPYLAMAVILAAGLDGIRSKIQPPPPTDRNVFRMTNEEREIEGIQSLPGNLGEALDELKNSKLVKEALGAHIYDKFIEAKSDEWNKYSTQVSEWEIEEYLAWY